MSLSFALSAASSAVPYMWSLPGLQPKLEAVRAQTPVPPEMNTPLLITLDAPSMDFGGMLQAPSQFADGATYGALARTALAPSVLQHWAGPADDAVSSHMARNLSGTSAAERMAGLGAALIKANKPVEMMIVADADHACILRADVQEHVWRFLLNNL